MKVTGKLLGDPMLVFTYDSEINWQIRPYEIEYQINTMKMYFV